jgi:hypothetical protein
MSKIYTPEQGKYGVLKPIGKHKKYRVVKIHSWTEPNKNYDYNKGEEQDIYFKTFKSMFNRPPFGKSVFAYNSEFHSFEETRKEARKTKRYRNKYWRN